MGKLDFKVKRLSIKKTEFIMVKMTKLRSVWVRGTGMSLIYEASGAKMGTNALYFTPITDTFNTLPILAEVSFQLKLQSTNLHKIFNKKREKRIARGHDLWFPINIYQP